MPHLLNTREAWLNFWLFPICWLLLKWIVQRFYAARKTIYEWCVGLPMVSWPGLLLIIIGIKLVSKKYCFIEVRDFRIWVSPKTFVVPDDAGHKRRPHHK